MRRYASAGTSCVCLSVTSRSCIEMAEWIELVLGTGASFHLSYTVLKGNSGIFRNKGTSLWNFVPNSGLRKFCFGISIVEMCYWLCSMKMDAHSMINWTVVGQLSWQCLRALALDSCSLSQVIIKLCLQHDFVVRSMSNSWYLLSKVLSRFSFSPCIDSIIYNCLLPLI